MYTRFKNLGDPKYFGFLPSHGRNLNSDVQIVLDGDLRTTLASRHSKRYGPNTYIKSLQSLIDQGEVEVENFPEAPQHGTYRTYIGTGLQTVFQINVGFLTAHCRVYVYDVVYQAMLPFVFVQRGVPGATWITISVSPAPGINQLDVFVFS